jgi:tyrosine-protein phosphatase non-receptor type 4
MPDTCSDFWEMSWELRSRTIVMLCTVSAGHQGCSQYFPAETVGGYLEFGDLKITLDEKQEERSFVVRKLSLCRKGEDEQRTMTHFQVIRII